MALNALEEKLIKWDTHPELVTLITHILESNAAPIFHRQLRSDDREVQQVITEQANLGWNLLGIGILGRAWKQCQIEYKRQRLAKAPEQEGTKWANKLQEGL